MHALLKSKMTEYLSLCYTYFEFKDSYFKICLVCGRVLAVSQVKHPSTISNILKEVRVKNIYRK